MTQTRTRLKLTPDEKAIRAVKRAAKEAGVSPAEMAGRVLGSIVGEPIAKIGQAMKKAGL